MKEPGVTLSQRVHMQRHGFVEMHDEETIKWLFEMPSSVFSRMHYDAATQTLEIVFVSGKVYEYLSVPRREYDAMKAASSKGTYLNQHIKPKYSFRQTG